MDVVLVMFKGNQRREFAVGGPRTVLGRRLDCQLRIPTKDVSRQHCALLIEKDQVIAKDLGSSNGTFVNDKRIAEVVLKPGDRLRLGPVTFVVRINGEPAEIKPEDVRPTVGAGAAAALEAADDEETFDLSDADFDVDEVLSADDEDDEKLP